MSATLIAELLALGVVVGFLAGLLGIGGGMMIVPVLSMLLARRGVEPGLALKVSIATAMATILFTALASLRAHHRLGAVRWGVVRTLSPGIVAGGLLAGGAAFPLLKGPGLALLFALFVGLTSLQMMRGKPPRPGRELPGAAGLAGVGLGIGFLSGLLGAGGAFLAVPFMTWCNVPPRQAVGTGAAIGMPVAAASTLGYMIAGWHLPPPLPGSIGYLYLPALVVMATASTLLAPYGARMAHRIDVGLLRKLFAGLLMVLAVVMVRRVWAG
ncbi:MAG: sulfite exporter TauE/SafE family protein [Rubrivivax sp.]